MWINNDDKDSSIWQIILQDSDSIKKIQEILARAIYETNIRKDFDNLEGDEDKNYLYNQVVSGNRRDVDMKEVNNIQSYGFIDQEDDHFYQKDSHDFKKLL